MTKTRWERKTYSEEFGEQMAALYNNGKSGRSINTMVKIGNLAKISEADCKYFDDLMTKYSRYEHSQALEAPVPLPEPDEIETDFTALKDWQAEFKKRPLTPALQEAQ